MRWAVAKTCLIILLITDATAWAKAPHSSLRPAARGFGTAVSLTTTATTTVITTAAVVPEATADHARIYHGSSLRPRPRGFGTVDPPNAVTASVVAVPQHLSSGYPLASTVPVFRSPRPLPRGQKPAMSQVENLSYTPATGTTFAGAICGDNAIRGEVVPAISATKPGCGVARPVRVYSVSGVALSSGATMDCPTAKALKRWVDKGVKPAVGARGGGLESLKVISDYSCRTRNNKPGAKISEHGKGRAIDIAAFELRDGSQISVLDDWRGSKHAKVLRKLHRSACGPFGTVLGPEADRHHQDHFHLDTARERRTAYCR